MVSLFLFVFCRPINDLHILRVFAESEFVQYFQRRSLEDIRNSLTSDFVAGASPGAFSRVFKVHIRAVFYGLEGYRTEVVDLLDFPEWLEKATRGVRTSEQERLWLDICGHDPRVDALLAHSFGIPIESIADAHVCLMQFFCETCYQPPFDL